MKNIYVTEHGNYFNLHIMFPYIITDGHSGGAESIGDDFI